jgi:uncharacterized membrane protein YagU involved in acid resistance
MRQALLSGVVAGAAGGIALELYLVVTLVLIRKLTDAGTLMKFVASGALGQQAFRGPAQEMVLTGTLIFFAIALFWGIGYAYVASTEPQIQTRPLVSGAVFGVVVFVTMQIVELTVRIWTWNPTNLISSLIGHIVFFGLPVAYVVARWHRL